jgi:hypothetical protein
MNHFYNIASRCRQRVEGEAAIELFFNGASEDGRGNPEDRCAECGLYCRRWLEKYMTALTTVSNIWCDPMAGCMINA